MRLSFAKSGSVSVRFFAVVFILLCSPLTYAYERIDGVYEATVEIENRSEQARNAAIQQGLEQVFVRYTGYSGIGTFPGLQAEFRNAQRYVIEYGVETAPRPLSDGLGVVEGDSLWIRYNASLIDQLATSLELPIWPTWRPSLEYLVVSELWGEPHFPTRTEQPALYLQLDKLFAYRGLQASSIDSKISGLAAVDVWDMGAQTAEQLKQASTADIVTVIRIRPETNNFSIDMLFMTASKDTRLHRDSESLIQGLNSGLNDYIDSLSAQLAFMGGADQEFELYLRVEGVRSFNQYRKLLDQLAGLEQVLFARMDRADDRGVQFLLRYQSDQALLIDSIVAITGLQMLDTTSARSELMGNETGIPQDFGMPGTELNPLRLFNPAQDFLSLSDLGSGR